MEKETEDFSDDPKAFEDLEKKADEGKEKVEKKTPKNDTVEEPKTETEPGISTKKFEEIDKARKVFYEENKRLKKQLSEKGSEGETNPMELVKLTKALEGYSEDEVDFITRNSADKSIDGIVEATKDEWVKTAIEARRKVEKDKSKVPGSSSPGSTSQDKDWREIQKFGVDEKGKADFREYAEKKEKEGITGI